MTPALQLKMSHHHILEHDHKLLKSPEREDTLPGPNQGLAQLYLPFTSAEYHTIKIVFHRLIMRVSMLTVFLQQI